MPHESSDLSVVIAEYLAAVDQGQRPDADEFLRQHPHLTDDLRSFLATQAELEQMGRVFTDAPGHTVRYVGDYELLDVLGQGGMGVVYRARQVSLRREVAVKLIRAGSLARPDEVARFRREAEAVANLDHPGIVPIHEVGVHDGQHYLAMKLIEGGDLHVHLARLRGDHKATARLLAAVARAVHHAHQRGILHRDLKPGNILVDAAGQPHVTDFGLAKLLPADGDAAGASLTATGAVVGTPAYMAPEQARGRKDVSTAADVYGLGAVLYLLLTGRPPFTGDDPLDVLRQVVETEPPAPRAGDAGIPRDLETICLKCLSKEPTKRYGSALALAEDLERWLAGQPITARPVTRRERLWKWMKRRPAAAALLLVSVTAAVLVFGGGSVLISQLTAALKNEREAVADRDRQVLDLDRTKQQLENEVKEKEGQKDKAQNEAEQARRQRDRAETIVYAGQIREAFRLWQEGKIEPARAALERTRWDYRGWEYRHLTGLLALPPVTLRDLEDQWGPGSLSGQSHTVIDNVLRAARLARTYRSLPGQVTCAHAVAINPQGTRIATGSGNRRVEQPADINVWDLLSGRPLYTAREEHAGVYSVAFSPDGRQLLTGNSLLHAHPGNTVSTEWTVQAWDAETGRRRATISRQRGKELSGPGIAYSPDGNFLATASGSWLELRDATSGELLCQGAVHTGGIRSIRFSANGDWVITASADKTARVWDIRPMRQMVALRGHTHKILSLAFSPDGSTILTSGWDTTLRLWNAKTGAELWQRKGPVITKVFYGPDDTTFGTVDGATVTIWDAGTREPLRTITTSSKPYRIEFSADRRSLLVMCRQPSTVEIWNLQSGERTLEWQTGTTEDTNAALSPDGKVFAHCERLKEKGHAVIPGTIALRDARSGARLRLLKGEASSASFSPDGTLLATALGAEITLWDVATGTPRQSLPTNALSWGELELSFSPDGSHLLVWCQHFTQIWEVRTGQRVRLPFPAEFCGELVFSPDCRRMAFPAEELGVVWDVNPAEPLVRELAGHIGELTAADLSPDGSRAVTASKDGTLKLWDTRTGDELATLRGHGHSVNSLAFSPDGTRILSGAHGGELKLWDAATGVELLDLPGLRFASNSVAFSPNGEYLVSAGGYLPQTRSTPGEVYGEVTVWHAPAGNETAHLKPRHGVQTTFYSPDGKTIVTTQGAVVTAWNARSGQELFTFLGDPRTVCFSADGRTLAASGDKSTVRIWDLDTGRCRFTLTGHKLSNWTTDGYNNAVYRVAFSPDGRRLASTADGGPEVTKIWDVATGKELASWDRNEESNPYFYGLTDGMAFSPDGEFVATAMGGVIAVHQATTGKLRSRLGTPNRFWPLVIAWGREGKTVVSLNARGKITVWDLESETARHSFSLPLEGKYAEGKDAEKPWERSIEEAHIRYHPTKSAALLVEVHSHWRNGDSREQNHETWVLDLPSGMPTARTLPDQTAYRPTTSPDGRHRLVVEDGQVNRVLVHPAAEPRPDQPALRPLDLHWHDEQAIAQARAGDWPTAVFHLDCLLRETPWDADLHLRKSWVLERLQQKDQAVAHHLHALMLRSRLVPQSPSLPRAKKPQVVQRIEKSVPLDSVLELKGVAFRGTNQPPNDDPGVVHPALSPDGKTQATADKLSIKVSVVATGEELFTCEGHTHFIKRLAISPNGKVLASGGWDRLVQLWDLQTGQPIATLTGHKGYVRKLHFSPDGKHLAVSCGGESPHGREAVYLWDLDTRKVRERFPDRYFESFGADGQSFALVPRDDRDDDDVIERYDLATLNKLGSWPGRHSCVSPDGKLLATYRYDHPIQIWDLAAREQRAVLGENVGYPLAFTAEGTHLVTRSGGSEIQVWKVPSRKPASE